MDTITLLLDHLLNTLRKVLMITLCVLFIIIQHLRLNSLRLITCYYLMS